MAFYVYILASKSRTLYIGITNHLDRRVAEHKEASTHSFTAKYRINRLVHFEEYASPTEAIRREKQLKGWLRKKKVALIESQNPAWEDLSADWGKPAPMRFTSAEAAQSCGVEWPDGEMQEGTAGPRCAEDDELLPIAGPSLRSG